MITEKLMALGSWSIRLRPETPQAIIDKLVEGGHIMVTQQRVSDQVNVLALSRYTGVVLKTGFSESERRLEGQGMVWHLADGEDKGQWIEGTVALQSSSFANAIRAVLPTSVTEGMLGTIAGTITHSFDYVSKRKAIEYLCSIKDAEYQVTPQGTFNAGRLEQLYDERPRVMVTRRAYGDDPLQNTLPISSARIEQDIDELTTRVVLVAQGDNKSVAVAAADLTPATTLKDLLGNPLQRTRVISESSTEGSLASVRAQGHLGRFSKPRRSLQLSTKRYEINEV